MDIEIEWHQTCFKNPRGDHKEWFPAVELNWKYSQSDVIANNPDCHGRNAIKGKSCFEDLTAFAVCARLSSAKFRFWRKCLLTSSLFFRFYNNLLSLTLSAILALLVSKPCEHNAGFSRDESQQRCLLSWVHQQRCKPESQPALGH